MQKIYVDDSCDRKFIAEMAVSMNEKLPLEEVTCQCGRHIQFPIVARSRDVELMEMMLLSASEAIREMGIENHLFAAIRAKCFFSIARKKALSTTEG